MPQRLELAKRLMDQFADQTGLTGKSASRRYLWTDAFAVCNFLDLRRTTGDERYMQLAADLVDQVHRVLGRHRPDDPRTGWISGLSEHEGAEHPTRGGLRIGKKLNERAAGEPPDSRLEWDRDGQYFHYLTRWMHALYRMHRETGKQRYLAEAAELAVASHRAFVYEVSPNGPKRMYWKMSIDLSRPLVSSMGQHDPLDGWITCYELRTAESRPAGLEASLDSVAADFSGICEHGRWATDDPLGIGGLLDAALRLAELVVHRGFPRRDLLIDLLDDAADSLQAFVRSPLLSHSADNRLAFRELGLAIGLHGLRQIAEVVSEDQELGGLVRRLLPFQAIAAEIDSTWSEPGHQRTRAWLEHRDINEVMLATSLLS